MRIRKNILLMAGIAMLTVVTYEVYANCIGCPPPGAVLTCPTTAQPTLLIVDGPQITIPSHGQANFEVVEAHEGPGAFNAQRLLSFQGSGDAPGFGTFTWMGDPNRTTTLSRVVSNTSDGGFPATSDIYMHMNVMLSWQPGRIYRSRTQIHVHSGNLRTWAPHVNEHYQLVEPVEFEDAESGELAFTLIKLPSVLN